MGKACNKFEKSGKKVLSHVWIVTKDGRFASLRNHERGTICKTITSSAIDNQRRSLKRHVVPIKSDIITSSI